MCERRGLIGRCVCAHATLTIQQSRCNFNAAACIILFYIVFNGVVPYDEYMGVRVDGHAQDRTDTSRLQARKLDLFRIYL